MSEQYTDQLLSLMRQKTYKPSSVSELEDQLQLISADEFKQLIVTLNTLENQGKIIRTKANRYALTESMNVIKGKLIGHAKGFGFVVPEEEGMDDIFIPPHEMNGAMDKDTVLVKVSKESHGDRKEGSITKIVTRNTQSVVGTFYGSAHYSYVKPDDKRVPMDIFIEEGQTLGAMEGHKVLVDITKYPTDTHSAKGIVTKVLGHKNDPGVDILSIVYKHSIPNVFPDEVLEQAEQTADQVSEKEIAGRVDCRDEMTVTIDGADAKDLDDAIHVSQLPNGHLKLTVHISDVSYYVQEGTPMDQEAYERGNSVYLIDRVIPMLPHKLSNGICSLNPNVDRLTMACEMEIDTTGHVVAHKIYESVIRTTERLTYDTVYQILEHEDEALMEQYKEVVPMLRLMAKLAERLRGKRQGRGAIDFNFKESKIVVDEEGWPVAIEMIERTVSEKLIEEFMLAANETVAEHFHWLPYPFLYRIHENPKEEKLERFFEFLTHFGITLKGVGNSIHPRALQDVLDEIQGLPEEAVISTMLLRSMQQAKYNEQSIGHFGLSTDYYTHFTAPIRRYSDLIVHRLIRQYLLQGKTSPADTKRWEENLPEMTTHVSETERRAIDAERDVEALKKAQFMVDKVGEVYEGVVSSVTNFGMFIELENTVEGLIHVKDMADDYYRYDDRLMMMIGERSAKQFRLGDKVKVEVKHVDVAEGAIDFVLDGVQSNRPLRKRATGPKVIETKGRSKQKKRPVGNQSIDRKKPEAKKKKKFYEGIAKTSVKKKRKRKK